MKVAAAVEVARRIARAGRSETTLRPLGSRKGKNKVAPMEPLDSDSSSEKETLVVKKAPLKKKTRAATVVSNKVSWGHKNLCSTCV